MMALETMNARLSNASRVMVMCVVSFESQGTYRVRGDVIDVFPADSARDAVRIELLDDEVESLSYFDPLTGEVVHLCRGSRSSPNRIT